MRKDHIRDYCTEAFRFYSKVGGKESYIENLVADMQKNVRGSGVSKPTEAALVNKERLIENKECEIKDLEAVERTLFLLERDCIKAIEYVYFKDADKPLEKGDIETRVFNAESEIPASRRQVYRWLRKARFCFAEERGLRV